jgi:starch phosphorylase
MEHGIAPQLRIYAGGLGMLAGCIEKTASDLRVPMVAVGLMYQWWFSQRLADGWQHEDWQRLDPAAAGLDRCAERVSVDLAGEPVVIQIWRARIGRVDLYLLDTNLPENPEHLRTVTDRLYGGDREHRLRQEIVLGVGGVRALRALGHRPTVYHANEGHAGFLCLERIREHRDAGTALADAVEAVRAGTVFTTHTAVPAGFDLFERWLIEKYFAGWASDCGVDVDWLMDLGHFPAQRAGEPFNMAVLCARLSGNVNAVSRLHREVTEERVLGPLWPGRAAPIRYVTNGVHPRTWAPARMALLFEQYLGAGWDYAGERAWEGVWDIPDEQLWTARQEQRAELLDWVWRTHGGPMFDPTALTVVVARRAAEYKETDLLVSQPERLAALTGDPARPVCLLVAGLAHPADGGGKERIRRIVAYTHDERAGGRVVYLPGYDMRVAQRLLSGADVWLNHPRRGDEACGTSFMKAVYNGGQVMTTADGGADELIVDGDNGWIIGDRISGATREVMADNAFGLLEKEIVPRFFERDRDGVPRAWLYGLKRSLATLGWQVSAGMMMRGYERLYRDAERLRDRAAHLARQRTAGSDGRLATAA